MTLSARTGAARMNKKYGELAGEREFLSRRAPPSWGD